MLCLLLFLTRGGNPGTPRDSVLEELGKRHAPNFRVLEELGREGKSLRRGGNNPLSCGAPLFFFGSTMELNNGTGMLVGHRTERVPSPEPEHVRPNTKPTSCSHAEPTTRGTPEHLCE